MKSLRVYGIPTDLDIATVSFLPLGADFNTAVYRVTTTDIEERFLKLRSGEFLEAHVSVPNYLADMGIKQSDTTSCNQNWATVWANLEPFKEAILYPYIEGRN